MQIKFQNNIVNDNNNSNQDGLKENIEYIVTETMIHNFLHFETIQDCDEMVAIKLNQDFKVKYSEKLFFYIIL